MRQMPKRQDGATLFIALIILLVVTLLAVSSVREVTLESRMTGIFIEQQRLLNAAEAGLREGEGRLTGPIKPLEVSCASDYCLRADSPAYEQKFDTSIAYAPSDGTASNGGTSVRWYALPAPSGSSEGASENPEYGNMMKGIGVFRYEVNAEATNNSSGRTTNLRSTTAKVFN